MTRLRAAGLIAVLGVVLLLVGLLFVDPLWPPQDLGSAPPDVVQGYYDGARHVAWWYRGAGAAFVASLGLAVAGLVGGRRSRTA